MQLDPAPGRGSITQPSQGITPTARHCLAVMIQPFDRAEQQTSCAIQAQVLRNALLTTANISQHMGKRSWLAITEDAANCHTPCPAVPVHQLV